MRSVTVYFILHPSSLILPPLQKLRHCAVAGVDDRGDAFIRHFEFERSDALGSDPADVTIGLPLRHVLAQGILVPGIEHGVEDL